jgi:hypothetical protein
VLAVAWCPLVSVSSATLVVILTLGIIASANRWAVWSRSATFELIDLTSLSSRA